MWYMHLWKHDYMQKLHAPLEHGTCKVKFSGSKRLHCGASHCDSEVAVPLVKWLISVGSACCYVELHGEEGKANPWPDQKGSFCISV